MSLTAIICSRSVTKCSSRAFWRFWHKGRDKTLRVRDRRLQPVRAARTRSSKRRRVRSPGLSRSEPHDPTKCHWFAQVWQGNRISELCEKFSKVFVFPGGEFELST